jgi:hypothetical protein
MSHPVLHVADGNAWMQAGCHTERGSSEHMAGGRTVLQLRTVLSKLCRISARRLMRMESRQSMITTTSPNFRAVAAMVSANCTA